MESIGPPRPESNENDLYKGHDAYYWHQLLRRYLRHAIQLEGGIMIDPFYSEGISNKEWDEIKTIILENGYWNYDTRR